MRLSCAFILLALSPRLASAGAYFQQASFAASPSTVAGLDADSVGNLYVLGQPAAGGGFRVASYSTPGMSPLFSFDTGLSSPTAFAVEPSGVIDVLDDSAAPFTLRRYTNPGTLVGQSTYSLGGVSPNMVAAAIDKTNARLFIAYQYTYHPLYPMCLGCGGPSTVTKTTINEYDLQGNQLAYFSMPGADYTAGSCYTPTAVAADRQGNLWVADALCQQVLKFSASGTLLSSTRASWSSQFNPRGLWTDAAGFLYISQAVCGLSGCPWGVAKLGGDGSFVTSFAADSPVGAAWDSRILYLSSSGSQPLRRFVYNGAPSVPAETAPLGMAVQHSSAAALSWQASNDPDGDPITYTAYLGTAPTQLAAAGSTAQPSLTTQPLVFGVTYYWQIVAQDSYLGLPLQQTPAPVESFNLSLTNQPPGAFGVVAGTATAVTRATSVTLAWQAAVDPDGDPVVYDVFWQAPSQATMTAVGTTPQTSWQMSGLAFGATYYWSVRARDVYNASTWLAGGAPQPYHPVFQDTPPPVPAILGGTGTVAEHTFTPQTTLSWSSVADADGDPVAYRLYLGTNPAAMALVQDGTGTSSNLTNAQLGTTYYWEVSAYDPYAASTTAVQSLLFVLQDSPPSPVVYLTTATAFAQHTTSPTVSLSWAPSTDPDNDPVSYRLDVQASTGAWPSMALGAATSQTLGLQLETTYYWRVTAYDAYAASTGTWMSFVVHLANRPPYPIVYSSPSTITTRAPSFALSWQDTGDPDGDPVSYALCLSTNPAAQYLVQQGTSTAYALSFQFGTTSYWYVTATDSFGAQTRGALQTFLPVFQDTPPPAPRIFSGSGAIGEHTLSPSAMVAWLSVTDADGDPVAYRLAVGTSASALSVVQDGQALSYNLPSPLFGTTYYWQVTAHDPYAATSTPVQSLSLYLQNSAPQPFAILTGTGTAQTRATTQLLSWQSAVDPDGDAVTYDLAVSTTPGALPVVQSSTVTSYMLATQFGTTYYWQVTARDGFGGATPSGVQSLLPVFLNHPPTVPLNQSKTGTIAYHGFAPTQSFFWGSSTDPDGDPFAYSLAYGTDSSHMAVVNSATLGLTLPVPLNAGFFYRIVATDVYGAASPSPVNWVFYQFSNNPPGPFDVLGTTGTIATRQMSAALSWTASVDPDGDPVSYGVFFGTAPSALSLLTSTTKTSAALSALAFGTTYYWRVDAYDGFGGTTTASGGVQSLVNNFYDPAPSPIVYLSTAASYSEHTSSPAVTLSWAPSTNAASDPISYRLDVQTSSGAWPSLTLNAATSLALPVVFEATYTWRVAAFDPYGGTSTGAWMSFVVHLANQPPFPIQYLTPPSVSTRAASFALAWGATGDPDGDPVTYRLELGPSSEGLASVQLGTSTSFALPLQYGTTVYYRVTATDPFGAVAVGAVRSFYASFLNDPPAQPSIVGPFTSSPVVKTMKNAVAVTWQQVGDPQNDPITYTVYFGPSPASMAPLATIAQSAPGALSLRPLGVGPLASVTSDAATVTLTLTGLDYYKTYFLRVAASNPYGATAFAPTQTFSLASSEGFPKAYNYPNPFNPSRGGTNIVFNAPPSGYAQATVEVYSELQDMLYRRDFFNIPPGISQVHFDGRDRYGRPLYNGSYICRVRFSGPEDKEVFYLLVVK